MSVNRLDTFDQVEAARRPFMVASNPFVQMMNEKKHRIGEELISPRVLAHWVASGLVEDQRIDGKGWHRLSYSDLLWLKILYKLRQFGISIEALKQVKKCVEEGRTEWSTRPKLDYYLQYTIGTKTPAKLLVFPDGEALLGSQLEIDWSLYAGLIIDDYVSIDIGKLAVINEKIDYLDYSLPEVAKAFKYEVMKDEVVSVTVECRTNKFIMTSEQIHKNKNTALAARQLIQYGSLQESIEPGKSRYSLRSSKHIKK
jgi:DNA-binding transcriptional MerR regulator